MDLMIYIGLYCSYTKLNYTSSIFLNILNFIQIKIKFKSQEKIYRTLFEYVWKNKLLNKSTFEHTSYSNVLF